MRLRYQVKDANGMPIGAATSQAGAVAVATVLRKIEYWHQGSISTFKIMCRDGKGFWHGVHWDGKTASCFALHETDERKARKNLLEQ